MGLKSEYERIMSTKIPFKDLLHELTRGTYHARSNTFLGKMQYCDDEGDYVNLDSDEDLQSAIESCVDRAASDNKVPVLKVRINFE